MILSVRDLPAIRTSVDDLYRIIEHPDATNQVACDVFRRWSRETTMGEQSPAEVVSAAFIFAAIDEVMKKFGHHTRDECPEITKSDFDLQTKAVLLSPRDDLRTPLASHFLANNDRVRTLFLVELTGTLGKLDASLGITSTHTAPPAPPLAPPQATAATVTEGSNTEGEKPKAVTPAAPKKDKPVRHPDQPGKDRQGDILAAIRTAGMPLTRPELIEAMKLKTEGRLGGHLAWMVTNNVLINITQRGYWPAGEPVPE